MDYNVDLSNPEEVAAKMPQLLALYEEKLGEQKTLNEQLEFLRRLVGHASAVSRGRVQASEQAQEDGPPQQPRRRRAAPAQDRAVQALEQAASEASRSRTLACSGQTYGTPGRPAGSCGHPTASTHHSTEAATPSGTGHSPTTTTQLNKGSPFRGVGRPLADICRRAGASHAIP